MYRLRGRTILVLWASPVAALLFCLYLLLRFILLLPTGLTLRAGLLQASGLYLMEGLLTWQTQ